MDPSTASYYRAILFVDGTDTKPIPPTLMQLHAWAVKRNQALGLGGMITKAVALSVGMTWLSSTKEGREFARENTTLGDMFDESESNSSPSPIDWDSVPVESEVVVIMSDKTKKVGNYIGRRGNWLDVRVDGELKHFKTTKVQVAGA